MDNLQPQTVEQTEQPSKQEIIEQKRLKFVKRVRLFKIAFAFFVLFMIFSSVGISIYNKNKNTYNITAKDPDPVSVAVTEPTPIVGETIKEYFNNQHKFFIKFPIEDTYESMETTDNLNLLIKIYSNNIEPKENVDEFNILQGYIIRVVPLKISARTLEELTQVKRELYQNTCPSTSDISEMYSTNLDGYSGKQFTITNCNSDLVITYIVLEGNVYEIVQVYKGDVGFKQVYKNKTFEIVNSIDFIINGEKGIDSPFIKFEDGWMGYMFEYPRELDSNCCVVAPPPFGQPKIKLSVAQTDNSNAVSFYIDANKTGLELDEYVEKQIELLTDDYKVVKGFSPQGSKQEIEINGKKGIFIQNYSWKDNDLLFFKLDRDNNILIISKTDIDSVIYEEIEKSLKFFEPVNVK